MAGRLASAAGVAGRGEDAGGAGWGGSAQSGAGGPATSLAGPGGAAKWAPGGGQRERATRQRRGGPDVSVGGGFIQRRRVEMDLRLGMEGIRDFRRGSLNRHRGS